MAEGGLSELFQNKLFLQYLAGAGADLSAYGADTGKGFQPTNINATTQQNISSQNFMKLLQQLLGPDGTKGTFDSKGISLNIPKESQMFSSILGGEEPHSVDMSLAPKTSTTPKTGGISTVNPFVTSRSETNFSPADLAGLTPKDIAMAWGTKQEQDKLENKKASDVAEALYRQDLLGINRENAASTRLGKITELMKSLRKAPLEVPGLGNLSMDEFNALDTKTKAYAYYAFDAKKKSEEVLSYNDWAKQVDTPLAKQLYDLSQEDPDFGEWLIGKYKPSGATRITLGEKIEEKKKMSELSGQLYFNDPKWTTELDKYMASPDVWDKLANVPGKSGSPEYKAGLVKARAKEKAKFIEDKITAGGGKVVDAKVDGKTGIWTVQWPDGSTKEIKYAIYD